MRAHGYTFPSHHAELGSRTKDTASYDGDVGVINARRGADVRARLTPMSSGARALTVTTKGELSYDDANHHAEFQSKIRATASCDGDVGGDRRHDVAPMYAHARYAALRTAEADEERRLCQLSI